MSITVQPPDLVVAQPTVSKSTLAPGETFTLSATVRNQGAGSAVATILRYYRSTDATILSSDTEVGTDSVSALGANRSSAESITLTAPSSPGTYYYGACVEGVTDESSSANNCSAAVSITVQPPPSEPTTLTIISGDNQTSLISKPLPHPLVVEVRDQYEAPMESVTVTFAVTAGGGLLSVARVTTDANGRAESALTLGPNAGTNTVSVSATGIEQMVTFNAVGESLEFDLSVPVGTNLIHVPLKVTAVDGVAKTIESVADLYDALGGASTVNFLITRDSQTQEWRSYVVPSDKGTPADAPLADDKGIIVGLRTPTSIRLTGTPLGTNGNSTITLTPGLNLVGLPLNDSTITRVSDLLALDGIRDNVSVIIFSDKGEFKMVGRAGDPGDIEITGGAILYPNSSTGGDGWHLR